ncbi:MAG: Crp/Fnr family transcriptional regulator [Sphingopyxis sp.]|nr:Crp/Fnr family transcriptional regulator [Sphingopyxis sp.]
MTDESSASRFAAMLEERARNLGEWRERSVVAGLGVFEPQAENVRVFILTAGLVKLYYPVANGEEWTKSYIADRGVFGPTSIEAPVIQFGAKAIEDCCIGMVRLTWLARQLGEDVALLGALGQFQTWLFERKRQREEDLLCRAVEERYLAFVQGEAALAARLEQQEIAAYLRITPVALSRIRRRLKQRGRLLPGV